jgi:hypothetical protein
LVAFQRSVQLRSSHGFDHLPIHVLAAVGRPVLSTGPKLESAGLNSKVASAAAATTTNCIVRLKRYVTDRADTMRDP